MKFRTIPPDPDEFPRARLIVPSAIPLLIMLLAWTAERAGHVWNVHGDAIGVFLILAVSSVVAVVVTAFSLVSVVPALLRYPTLRSRINLISVAFASAFLLAALIAGASLVSKATHD